MSILAEAEKQRDHVRQLTAMLDATPSMVLPRQPAYLVRLAQSRSHQGRRSTLTKPAELGSMMLRPPLRRIKEESQGMSAV